MVQGKGSTLAVSFKGKKVLPLGLITVLHVILQHLDLV